MKKRILALLVALLFSLSLFAGCADDRTGPAGRETTVSPIDETEWRTFAPTEATAPVETLPPETEPSETEPPATEPPETDPPEPLDGEARGIRLSDTYDEAGILYEEELFYTKLFQLARGHIDGLMDETVEARINSALAEEAKAAYDQCEEDLPQITHAFMSSSASRASNVLSVCACTYGHSNVREYKAWHTYNYSLLDGRELNFYDLFTNDAEGKDIFNHPCHARILQVIRRTDDRKDAELMAGEPTEIDGLIPNLIAKFDTREDFRFTFDGDSFTIYLDVEEETVAAEFRFADMMDKVAVFQRFRADRELYTGEYPAVKNIPILVDRRGAVNGLYEFAENYYFNVCVQEVPTKDIYEGTYNGIDIGFYNYYDQKLEYLRYEINEAVKEGKYVLLEVWCAAFDDGKRHSFSSGGYYVGWGDFSLNLLVVNTQEEFLACYEKVLEELRADKQGDPAETFGGLSALSRENTGSGSDYEVQMMHEDIYGGNYNMFRPFVRNRIKLNKLKDKSTEEIMALLASKGIVYPERIAKSGREAEVTEMVIKELLLSANAIRLYNRTWSFTDPLLVETANRIADCIKE